MFALFFSLSRGLLVELWPGWLLWVFCVSPKAVGCPWTTPVLDCTKFRTCFPILPQISLLFSFSGGLLVAPRFKTSHLKWGHCVNETPAAAGARTKRRQRSPNSHFGWDHGPIGARKKKSAKCWASTHQARTIGVPVLRRPVLRIQSLGAPTVLGPSGFGPHPTDPHPVTPR